LSGIQMHVAKTCLRTCILQRAKAV